MRLKILIFMFCLYQCEAVYAVSINIVFDL